MSGLREAAPTIKVYQTGTHRTCAPEETVARLTPLLDMFGVTRIANLTGLDRSGIPVVMVCRPNARSSAVFHGKGIDLAAAKASGLMEAVETWHAERIELPLRLASFAEIRARVTTCDIDGLPRIPAGRFHDDLQMLWVEGNDLVSREPVWLPFEVVHANSTLPSPPGHGCFAASTNGLASGNHLLEAVSHGLCEVIERDATSLWNRRSPAQQNDTRLDLSTVSDNACRMVIDRLAECRLDVAAWETTTDVGVPAFQCLVVDAAGEIDHIGKGAGCHPVREIALLRALTEAVQVRTTYIVGSREDITYEDYRPATLEAHGQHARALMRPFKNARDFSSCGRFEFNSFETEIAWLIERLTAVGVKQVIAVDLSHPELGIAVARVVVPGLEGSDHHSGYVPGPRARATQGARR